jgi:hypothetical protein
VALVLGALDGEAVGIEALRLLEGPLEVGAGMGGPRKTVQRAIVLHQTRFPPAICLRNQGIHPISAPGQFG